MQLGIALRLGTIPTFRSLALSSIAFDAPDDFELTSGPTDYSPNFQARYDTRGAAGNWIRLQFATDTAFTQNLASYDHQLTGPELSTGAVPITVTDLNSPEWYARLRHTLVQNPDAGTYVWSATVQILLDLSGSGVSYLLRKDGVSKYLRKDGTSFLLR